MQKWHFVSWLCEYFCCCFIMSFSVFELRRRFIVIDSRRLNLRLETWFPGQISCCNRHPETLSSIRTFRISSMRSPKPLPFPVDSLISPRHRDSSLSLPLSRTRFRFRESSSSLSLLKMSNRWSQFFPFTRRKLRMQL